MSAITQAVYSRMAGDATLTGMLATFAGLPCIFSTDPVPPQAPRPYIDCSQILTDMWIANKTNDSRDHWRDVIMTADATGDATLIEAIAERVRTLFNRQLLTVGGYVNYIAMVTGPVNQPSDPTLYARRLTVKLALVSS